MRLDEEREDEKREEEMAALLLKWHCPSPPRMTLFSESL